MLFKRKNPTKNWLIFEFNARTDFMYSRARNQPVFVGFLRKGAGTKAFPHLLFGHFISDISYFSTLPLNLFLSETFPSQPFPTRDIFSFSVLGQRLYFASETFAFLPQCYPVNSSFHFFYPRHLLFCSFAPNIGSHWHW